MNREEKSAAIEEIAAQIQGAEAIFAVDYRGISVAQAAELRGRLREADASFRIVKNRLTKIAADKAGEARLTELLEGPTALTFVRGDTASAAKAISTFNREHGVLAFKGGFMEALALDEDTFKSIARLPSREVLDGQLAGVVASPLTGLVRGLGSMIQGLALQLGQMVDQGLVGASDEVAEEAVPGSQGDGAPADGGGSEAEQPSDEETPEEAEEAEEATEEQPPAEEEAPAEEEPAKETSDDEGGDTSAEETDDEAGDAEASDEVAEEADQGSQGDGAPADGGGSEAEQSSDDSETSNEEEKE